MCRKCGCYPEAETHLCAGVEPEWLKEIREKMDRHHD